MANLLFFDIDGTLWDNHSRIPESTISAIRRARANGCLVFINSGRSRAYIRDKTLFGIGFDGVVSGDGTTVEFPAEDAQACSADYHQNRIVLDQEHTPEEALRTVELLKKYRFFAILEGRDWLYIDLDEFGPDAYVNHVATDMGDHLLPITGCWNNWHFTKFSADLRSAVNREEGLAKLAERYEVLQHTHDVFEFVPRGCSKATGIQAVCRLLGASPADTYAFGDSANDIPMLREAAHGIAMGNGTQEAKEAAEFVTASLEENGIELALRHYGLI